MKLGIWHAEHFLFIFWSVVLSNGSFDWSTQGMGSDHTPKSGLSGHTEHSESFPNYSEESLGVPRQIQVIMGQYCHRFILPFHLPPSFQVFAQLPPFTKTLRNYFPSTYLRRYARFFLRCKGCNFW